MTPLAARLARVASLAAIAILIPGAVTFTYDSGMDDGWMGGRVDPFVRCYFTLMLESGDQAVEKASVVRPTRTSFPSLFTEASTYVLETETWDGNNENRQASVTAEHTTKAETQAFAVLDAARARHGAPPARPRRHQSAADHRGRAD